MTRKTTDKQAGDAGTGDEKSSDATATPDTVAAHAHAHQPGTGDDAGADSGDLVPADEDNGGATPGARPAGPGRVDAQARDLGSADTASVHAPANQNAASFGRTEELFAAENTLRGGVTPAPAYPVALPREEQEDNAQAAALTHARNATGTRDGISSVLPAVGGTTNMAMTGPERYAQLDDEAVDAQGRLVGNYLDDRERAAQAAQRELIEGRGSRLGADGEQRRAAADRIRSLAASPAVSAADIGRPADEQALVNPDKHTSHDSSDVNDPNRRAAETAEANQAGGARA